MPAQALAGQQRFSGIGVIAFVSPGGDAKIVGLANLTRLSCNKIQAVYGGFGVAMAVTLLYAATTPNLRDAVLFTTGAALAGMALGRVVAAVREWPGPVPVLSFGIEAVRRCWQPDTRRSVGLKSRPSNTKEYELRCREGAHRCRR